MKGALYVVATPIGNLEDITERAIKVLKEVDTVLCEDTRRSRILLSNYGIKKPLLSYHEQNEEKRVPQVVQRIEEGETFALISDAGTPCISDPGYRLVKALRDKELPVYAVPGPSALTAAISIAGLPTDRFVFEGYLPKRKGKRRRKLEELTDEPRTIVLFESVHRIEKILDELCELFPERKMALLREITKLHEEVIVGSPQEVKEKLKNFKGEFVIIIEGKGKVHKKDDKGKA